VPLTCGSYKDPRNDHGRARKELEGLKERESYTFFLANLKILMLILDAVQN
jgi:hypothetical protein